MSATIKVAKRTIVHEDGTHIEVEPQEGVGVRVIWFCGEGFSFSAEQFEQACKALDAVADHPDVWVSIATATGSTRTLSARLAGDMLQADNRPNAGAQMASWKHLRKAMKRTFKEMEQ